MPNLEKTKNYNTSCGYFQVHLGSGPRAWEEAGLMEVQGEGCHPGGAGERLLHPVPMVYIQVDVEHSLEAFLQGVNSEDHIVHIAETPSIVSVGMVPPTIPVDRNICAF